MELLNPAALWFLALIPPVVLLYLLKMRRRPVEVSSTLLWEQVLSDIQANTPFQRLRANLQLILQLLIVILLTLAVANLLIPGGDDIGRSIVVIVDASASMNSRDGKGGGTRLDEVRRRLTSAELIGAMTAGDEMMVLVAAGGGVVGQHPFTSETKDLTAFAQAIAPTDGGPGVREALLVAFAALQRRPGGRQPEIVLLSDGGTGDLSDLGDAPVPVRYKKCGQRGENVAITGLRLRRLQGGRHAIFAEVTNATTAARTVFLSLGEGVEGGEIASARLDMKAASSVSRTFEVDIAPGPINLSVDAVDDLPVDNRAVTFVPPPERAVVALLGVPSPFVRRALETDELVELRRYQPGGLYDLVLATGKVPDPLPDCPTVIFAPAGDLPEGVGVAAEIQAARLTRWNRRHPLLQYLELGDVAIYKAAGFTGPAALPLVWARPSPPPGTDEAPPEAPVVVALAGRRHPTLVIGFPLKWSNWPLRASFPLFVFNMVEHARALRRRDRGRTLAPGETLPLELDEDLPLAVERPDGQTDTLPPPGKLRYYHRTDRVGVYRWTAGARRGAFAVNLLDRAESSTAPTSVIDLGQQKQVEQESDEADEPRRPIWRYLALLALLLTLLEWWAFHRKIG